MKIKKFFLENFFDIFLKNKDEKNFTKIFNENFQDIISSFTAKVFFF
jgi:hypothetical protein